jgi:hypothetical protein
MKKLVICLAVLMVASTPAAAKQVKKAVKPAHATVAQPMTQNQASWRLLRESLPLFLPSVAQAVYLSKNNDADKKDARPKKAN